MKYERINKKIKGIKKYKNLIILLSIILNVFLFSYLFINEKNIFPQHKTIWIENQEKTLYNELTIPLTIPLKKLKQLNEELSKNYEVMSIFNETKWGIEGEKSSNILKPYTIKNHIKANTLQTLYKNGKYKKYLKNKNIIFYIKSHKEINSLMIKKLIGNNFKLSKYEIKNISKKDILMEIISIYILIILIMWIIFKTIHPGLILTYISMSVLLSVITIVHYLKPNVIIDFKIIYIMIIFSIIDYLYFQYRWVIFSKKHKRNQGLIYSIMSNIKPAFWTSLITVLSISFLLLINSSIIQILSLSIILTTILTLLYNIFLFPSLGEYFKPKYLNTFKKVYQLKFNFNNNNINIIGTIITILAMILISIYSYLIITNKNIFVNLENKTNVVILKQKEKTTDYKSYKELRSASEYIKLKYPKSKTYSLFNEIKKIKRIDNEKYIKESQEFENLLFQIKFNNINKKLKTEDGYFLLYVFNLNEVEKKELLSNDLKIIKFIPKDLWSKIIDLKLRTNEYISISIFISILLLSIFISILFNNKNLFLSTIIINMLPLTFFSFLIYIFKIKMDFEMLIAISIAFTLTADSIIHYNYRYWKSRELYKYSKEKSIKEVILFSVIPMLISTLILISIFLMLAILHNELIKFSIYIITVLSITTLIDIIIYPILLLSSDSKKKLFN